LLSILSFKAITFSPFFRILLLCLKKRAVILKKYKKAEKAPVTVLFLRCFADIRYLAISFPIRSRSLVFRSCDGTFFIAILIAAGSPTNVTLFLALVTAV